MSARKDKNIKPRGRGGAPLRTRWARQDADVKLMLRFQQGDVRAFEELVRRNTPKIHSLVYRFLGDSSQAEDLAQEVFLRVYRTAERYQPTAKFSTWLYRISANLCFNVLRDRHKGRAISFGAFDGQEGEGFQLDVPDDGSAQPHAGMDRRELSRKIAEAIGRLPENQKAAIILNRFEKKTYSEIAEILDCSTLAVKSLLSRARSNLHNALRGYLRPE